MRSINLAVKRGFDIISSLVGIIVFFPILLVTAILVKVSSKGPVFFIQERLGKDRQVFNMIKFRTMIVNAEELGDGLFVYGDHDNRITKVGKFLRKTSLDELPQLFNVVKGDMSLVGPRPPVTYYPYKAHEYSQSKIRRFDMRPGITGLAQVRTRTTTSWDKRIDIDIEYVENFNVFMDIRILIDTIKTVILRKNIYPETPEQIENKPSTPGIEL